MWCSIQILRMKILSAGRGPQPVCKGTEGCQSPACAISEMTQLQYSVSFGKTNCGPPGSTMAAAVRPEELHLHGCQVCRPPFCQSSQDSAEFCVLAVALPMLTFQRDLGGKISFWENGNFCFLKKQMSFKLLEFTGVTGTLSRLQEDKSVWKSNRISRKAFCLCSW